jgi:stage II sporulation protein D
VRRFVLTAFVVFAVSASPALATPVFVVTGNGYGHGVGMSQYGAQGYALHAWAYRAILGHYYSGTTVESRPSVNVRVLVASARATVPLGSSGGFTFAGQPVAAGTYAATVSGGEVVLTGNGTTTSAPSPVTVTPTTSSPLALDGNLYRGQLALDINPTGALDVANELSLENYIRGVVPREMPSSWQPEALKAQAVAARTYALATSGHCSWNGVSAFCADTRDQVYGGKSAETTATSDAVDATAGETVTYPADGTMKLATTYFFSTSGGKTCSATDCFGSAVSYLASVPDAYDSISPHHFWGPGDPEVDCPSTVRDCVYTARELGAALGLAEPPDDATVTLNASSRAATVDVKGATTTTFTGTAMRTKLGLRSTWFRIGVLSLTADHTRITYGASVTVSGLARSGGTRGWGVAYLERRRYGETAWSRVGTALPNGPWSSVRRPPTTTDYRVVSGNATGIAERVYVRTKVTFTSTSSTRLAGKIGPPKGGVTVTLRRQAADGSWTRVATTTTRSDGTFSFRITRAGRYEAAADAGFGLLPGSATATV